MQLEFFFSSWLCTYQMQTHTCTHKTKKIVVVGCAWRFGGGEQPRDCEWCGSRRCELATTRGGTAAPPAPRDFLLCRAVVVQIGWDSPGESLAGFLLVMMTTASKGVVLLVGGVILEPFPSARVSPGESHVHLLDERRRRLWRRYLFEGIVGGDTSWPGGGRPPVAWRDGLV